MLLYSFILALLTDKSESLIRQLVIQFPGLFDGGSYHRILTCQGRVVTFQAREGFTLVFKGFADLANSHMADANPLGNGPIGLPKIIPQCVTDLSRQLGSRGLFAVVLVSCHWSTFRKKRTRGPPLPRVLLVHDRWP